MKKFLLLLALFIVPVLTFGQNNQQRISIAIQNRSGYAQIIPNAQVTVCTYNSLLQCNAPITVYSDAALTKAIAYPFFADANGNYSYYAPANTYVEQVCAPLNQCYNYAITLIQGSGIGCPGGCVLLNPTLPQNIVQPPGTTLGLTDNTNGANLFVFSNNNSGANAISGIEFVNDVGVAFLGFGSSGIIGGGSDLTLDNGTPGASTTIQANVGNLVFKTGSASTALTISPTNQATFTSGLNWGTDSGTANAYVVTRPAGSTTLYDGEDASFIALNNSNGPSTMNLDGSGVLPFDKNGTTALGSGDILAGATYNIKYNLATTTWQLLNSSLTAGGVTQIIAGNNITISPTSGLGAVTINSTGGGGSGCTSGCVLYAPAGNQNVAQPNVGGTQTTLAVNSLNNYYLASQFTSGAGNNGIANIAALNDGTGLTGIADPGYGTTETVPTQNINFFGSASVGFNIPGWPDLTHIIDNREGSLIDTYSQNAVNTGRFAAFQYYYNTTAALNTAHYVELVSGWQANFR
jgi:hypothetical protein